MHWGCRHRPFYGTQALVATSPPPPAWDYGPEAETRKVAPDSDIWISNRGWKINQALVGETVQIRRIDQRVLVYFCNTLVREIDFGSGLSTAADRPEPKPHL